MKTLLEKAIKANPKQMIDACFEVFDKADDYKEHIGEKAEVLQAAMSAN